jgi:adenylate cyclase
MLTQSGPSAADTPALVATAISWLAGRGLDGSDVPELVAGLCVRLNASGLAIDRAGCAILTLHPQIVSQEVVWHSDEGRATTAAFTATMMVQSRRGPYFYLNFNRIRYKRFILSGNGTIDDMPLLDRLRSEGYTEYLGFFHPTGGAGSLPSFARRLGLVPCVVGSFATRQPGGFRETEIDCLKSISETFALTVKARTNYDTASRLLNLYVGRSCGTQVLEGQITRGDSDRIFCGIWFCDLRQSSRLVTQLPLDDYIALLNRYFDAVVGAVMGTGGEVLKFIGDAVMGIFPSDHPEEDVDMRDRALAASIRTLRDIHSLVALGHSLEVGIALHVGEVMYGNVGTDERLDFTVIGRAVNEAARLQGLTKQLGHSILASSSFVYPIRDRFEFVGAYAVAGFDEMLEAYIPRL